MSAEAVAAAPIGGYLRLRVMDDRVRRHRGFLDGGQGYGLPVMMRSWVRRALGAAGAGTVAGEHLRGGPSAAARTEPSQVSGDSIR